MRELFDKLYTGSRDNFYEYIRSVLGVNGKKFIVTANPETFMLAENNPGLKDIITDDNTVVIPDGIGLVIAARSLGKKIEGRITGVELVSYLLECADKLNKNVFLYGAKPEVIKAMTAKLSSGYPGITISGAYNGYESEDEYIEEKVIESKPDIMFAALGMPRQEYFLSRCAARLNKGIFIGIGGSFDVISGIKKRAPALFIKCNLEWLYRIIMEPKRIKRFYRNNIKFLFVYKK